MLWQTLARNESKGEANWTQTYLARDGRRSLQELLLIHLTRRSSFCITVWYRDCGEYLVRAEMVLQVVKLKNRPDSKLYGQCASKDKNQNIRTSIST